MEPITRIALEYPIYALDTLDDDTIIVGGGGGIMKSGIPNACNAVSFNEATSQLMTTASIPLSDAILSLTTHKGIIYTAMGHGLKFLSHKPDKQKTILSPNSRRQYDIKVSSSQEQSAVAVSADGSTLIVASDEGHVISMKLPRYELKYRGQLHSQGITDLAITFDGNIVATTGRDNAAYIWEAYSGNIIQKITPIMPPSSRTHICAIRFSSRDPNSIITAESNPRKSGWIAVWKKQSNQQGGYVSIASIKASDEALTELTVNETGNLIATSTSEGHLLLFSWNDKYLSPVWSTETKTGWFKSPQPPHVLPITAMKFSSSSSHLFAASADYTITTWPTVKPTNWRRIRNSSFWIVAFMMLIIAALIGEDGHIPNPMRNSMEPHLSNFQSRARPIVREGKAQLKIYVNQIHQIAKPHLEKIQEQGTSAFDQSSQGQGKGESNLKPDYEMTKDRRGSQKDLDQYGETEPDVDTFKEQNSRESSIGSTVSSINDADQIDDSMDNDTETTIQEPTPDQQEERSEPVTEDANSLEKEHIAATVNSSTDLSDTKIDEENDTDQHREVSRDDITEYVNSDEPPSAERSSEQSQSDFTQYESTQSEEKGSISLNDDEVQLTSSSLEPHEGTSHVGLESTDDDGNELDNQREALLPQGSPEFDNLKAVEENRGQLDEENKVDKEGVLIENESSSDGDKETESMEYATVEKDDVTAGMTEDVNKSIADELDVRADKVSDNLVMNEDEKNLNESSDPNSEEEGETSSTEEELQELTLSDKPPPDELSVIPVNTMEPVGEHTVDSDVIDASTAPLDEDYKGSEGGISSDYPHNTDLSIDPLTRELDDVDEDIVNSTHPIDDEKHETNTTLPRADNTEEISHVPIKDDGTSTDTDSTEKEDDVGEIESEDSPNLKNREEFCSKPSVWQVLFSSRRSHVGTKSAFSTDNYIKSQSSKDGTEKTNIQKEAQENHEVEVHNYESSIESENVSNVKDDETSDISWKDTPNKMQVGGETEDISIDKIKDEDQDKIGLDGIAEASVSENIPDEDLAFQSEKLSSVHPLGNNFEDKFDSQTTAQIQ